MSRSKITSVVTRIPVSQKITGATSVASKSVAVSDSAVINNAGSFASRLLAALQAVTTIANIDQSQVTLDGNHGTMGFGMVLTQKIAQSFVPTQQYLSSIIFRKGSNTGTFTGDVTVTICADSAGSPFPSTIYSSLTILAAAWNAIPNNTDYEMKFPAILTVGTRYWIILSSSTADDSNYTRLYINSGDVYANGKAMKYNGSAWADQPTSDLYFKTFYAKKTRDIVLSLGSQSYSLDLGVDGNPHGAVIDLANSAYRYFVTEWKESAGALLQNFSDFFSYSAVNGGIRAPANGLSIAADRNNTVTKHNLIYPAKLINFSAFIDISPTRSCKIQYSYDNVNWVDWRSFDSTDSGIIRMLTPLTPPANTTVFYTRYVAISSTCYVRQSYLTIKLDISSARPLILAAGNNTVNFASSLGSQNFVMIGGSVPTIVSSGISRTKVTTNPRVTSREMKYALHFNGGTDKVVVPNILTNIAAGYTFACWIKSPLVSSNVGATSVFVMGSGSGFGGAGTSYIYLKLRGSLYHVRCQVNGGSDATATTPQIPNKGTFVVGTFDPADLKCRVYVNGLLGGTSGAMSGFGTLNVNSLNIGGGYDLALTGFMDSPRVWNRALSAEEIKRLYYRMMMDRTGLINELLFNENTGLTAHDSSGNGADGTITGATWTSDVPMKGRTLVT